MKNTLSILAVALACAALVITILTRGGPSLPAPIDVVGDTANALAAQFETFQREQQALKDSNRELLLKVTQLERGKGAEAGGPAEIARINQRLDQVEATQTELARQAREFDKYGLVSAMEKDLVTAYSTLMDTNQNLMTRVRQAEKLKRSGHFDEKAAAAMTDLYRRTENLNEKAGVLTALSGTVTPELRDQILADLNQEIQGGNKSGRFRYSAIEALEPLLPDPTVRQWLGHLAQNDPEPKIAARAGQPLGLTPAAGGARK